MAAMTVSDIMMRSFSAVASVQEDDALHTVTAKLSLNGLGAVVVLSASGKLVGIVSDHDVVQALSTHRTDFAQLRARDLMKTEVLTCSPAETELELMAVMMARNIRHMPVMVDEKVVGMVTLEDAVRQRLEKIGRLARDSQGERDDQTRLGILDRHLKDNLSIFEVFRAVSSVQEEVGLARLEPRAREMLWVIGEGERRGRPLQLKDLMMHHRWGAYPTVRRHLLELQERGWITYGTAPQGQDWKGKRYCLSDAGRQAFARMSQAMAGTIMSTDPAAP